MLLHRWFRHAWYLTWLAERIHVGRGPIDGAQLGHTQGTMHVCKNMTSTLCCSAAD
jgi:hypothetical protein